MKTAPQALMERTMTDFMRDEPSAPAVFTRQRDALTRRRMAMRWERVAKSYQFEGPGDAPALYPCLAI
jgi:predicted dithiol-disulfide oxidoreductase (DUF899 family)